MGGLLQTGGLHGHDAGEVAVMPLGLTSADPNAQPKPLIVHAATVGARRRLEDPDPGGERFRGRSKCGHEPVALSLHELAGVVGEDPPSRGLELPVDRLESGLANVFAELGGTDDVDDDHHRDVAPRVHSGRPVRAMCDAEYAAILVAMSSSPG